MNERLGKMEDNYATGSDPLVFGGDFSDILQSYKGLNRRQFLQILGLETAAVALSALASTEPGRAFASVLETAKENSLEQQEAGPVILAFHGRELTGKIFPELTINGVTPVEIDSRVIAGAFKRAGLLEGITCDSGWIPGAKPDDSPGKNTLSDNYGDVYWISCPRLPNGTVVMEELKGDELYRLSMVNAPEGKVDEYLFGEPSTKGGVTNARTNAANWKVADKIYGSTVLVEPTSQQPAPIPTDLPVVESLPLPEQPPSVPTVLPEAESLPVPEQVAPTEPIIALDPEATRFTIACLSIIGVGSFAGFLALARRPDRPTEREKSHGPEPDGEKSKRKVADGSQDTFQLNPNLKVYAGNKEVQLPGPAPTSDSNKRLKTIADQLDDALSNGDPVKVKRLLRQSRRLN